MCLSPHNSEKEELQKIEMQDIFAIKKKKKCQNCEIDIKKSQICEI